MITPITIGQYTFIFSVIFLLFEILITIKDFRVSLLLQIIICPILGFSVDLGMQYAAVVTATNYSEEILILLAGCVILALGIFMQVRANLMFNPGEGIVKVIAEKLRIRSAR
jgi:uncharacterized membrane protein YczE